MSDVFDDDNEILSGEIPGGQVNLGPLIGYPGYLFRRAQSRIYQGLYPVLAPYAMRPTQGAILLLLKYNPGIKPSDVAAMLGLQRTNFAPLLIELRQRGLADSQSGTTDKRTRALCLTDKGQALVDEMEAAITAYESRIAAEIDPEGTGILQKIAVWLTGGV